MATVSGSYREPYTLTIAGVLGAGNKFDDFLDAVEARAVVVNGGPSTLVRGTITAKLTANDGSAVANTWSVSTSIYAGPTTPVVNAKLQSLGLGTFLTELETRSDHTTVTNVDLTANISCST
jgi:hypothetical protein